ncbi:hypothetical protein B0O99DRAFT_686176 [Bisporella sp. PMI_857]|nr:hypothetical protein B0O99DRAFT_686176 [Bisporella sp. PMI_857]
MSDRKRVSDGLAQSPYPNIDKNLYEYNPSKNASRSLPLWISQNNGQGQFEPRLQSWGSRHLNDEQDHYRQTQLYLEQMSFNGGGHTDFSPTIMKIPAAHGTKSLDPDIKSDHESSKSELYIEANREFHDEVGQDSDHKHRRSAEQVVRGNIIYAASRADHDIYVNVAELDRHYGSLYFTTMRTVRGYPLNHSIQIDLPSSRNKEGYVENNSTLNSEDVGEDINNPFTNKEHGVESDNDDNRLEYDMGLASDYASSYDAPITAKKQAQPAPIRDNHIGHVLCTIKNVNHYQKIKHAEENRRNTLANQSRRGPRDFPKSSSAQQALVIRLSKAAKNGEDLLDCSTKNGNPSQAEDLIVHGAHGGLDGEFWEGRFWELLIAIRDSSHGSGNRLIEHFPNYKYQEFDDFMSRFEAVEEGLARSKALSKQIMDVSYVDRLAQSPGKELTMKVTNKKLNYKRNVENSLGRSALKAGHTEEDFQQEFEPTVRSASSVPYSSRRQTGMTQLATCSKRKRNMVTEEMENKEGYTGSTKKRQNRATLKRPSAHGKMRETPSKATMRLSLDSLYSVQSKGLGTTHSFAVAPTYENESEEDYRRIICELLRVSVEDAEELDLQQLRTYARTYNQELSRLEFQVQYGNQHFSFEGPLLLDEALGITVAVHIAQIIDVFDRLAKIRQDLTENGQIIEDAIYTNTYSIRTDLDRRALGLVRNPFGILYGL